MMSTSSSAAAAVAILPAKAPLPLLDDGLTVVSFNVLLPNGNDGWWMYKVCVMTGKREKREQGKYTKGRSHGFVVLRDAVLLVLYVVMLGLMFDCV